MDDSILKDQGSGLIQRGERLAKRLFSGHFHSCSRAWRNEDASSLMLSRSAERLPVPSSVCASGRTIRKNAIANCKVFALGAFYSVYSDD